MSEYTVEIPKICHVLDQNDHHCTVALTFAGIFVYQIMLEVIVHSNKIQPLKKTDQEITMTGIESRLFGYTFTFDCQWTPGWVD